MTSGPNGIFGTPNQKTGPNGTPNKKTEIAEEPKLASGMDLNYNKKQPQESCTKEKEMRRTIDKGKKVVMAVQEGSDFSVQESPPPGYRFKPTDVELLYYLNLKIMNKCISIDAIKEVDLYKYHPHDLCQSRMNGTQEGYFFTSRTKKYTKGSLPDRAAADGYWKRSGVYIIVRSNGQEVGRKNVLVYYEGKFKNNNGKKTNWIMHEYTIHQKKDVADSSTNAIPDDKMLDICVCKIYNKTSKSRENKEEGTQRNTYPVHETHIPDANLTATSSYQNHVPALGQSSLQGAYVPDQQARINNQYPLVHEPVTYMHGDMAMQSNILPSPQLAYYRGDHMVMESNIVPSPQPLAYISGNQSNVSLYNPLFPPEQRNDQYQPVTHLNGDVGTSKFVVDDGSYLDLTTPSILDSFFGDSSNAQLQYSPPNPHLQGDVGGSRQSNFAASTEYWDLPSPPTEWLDLDDIFR
ncbi:NAC domain-containing 72-like [Olea europaea subsp. europaea]|uniref:NAC domain-containing 72-like n=1 Tax=Olea europaea subsp. europaea TaxID=158383 RepID=A0A8S0RWY1_OLEEU|nr:NAC domain-containing 72-like [Olea europaea subsp. europaea]